MKKRGIALLGILLLLAGCATKAKSKGGELERSAQGNTRAQSEMNKAFQ